MKKWFVAAGIALIATSSLLIYNEINQKEQVAEKPPAQQDINEEITSPLENNLQEISDDDKKNDSKQDHKNIIANTAPEKAKNQENAKSENNSTQADNQETNKKSLTPEKNYQSNTNTTNNPSEFEGKPGFTSSHQKACKGDVISFSVNSPVSGAIYQWELGDGSIKYGTNIKHQYKENGDYLITLVMNPKEGRDVSHSNQIRVYPSPTAGFTYSKDKNLTLKDPYTEFQARKNNLLKYTWEIDGEQQAGTAQTDYIFKKKGEYNVALTTENTYGCIDTKVETISVQKSFELKEYAPTAIFPGSSIEENKTFLPRILEVDDVKFEMFIFDMKNEKVYFTDDADKPWNGRINNTGNIIPGNYSWKVITMDKKGIEHIHFGTLKLISK